MRARSTVVFLVALALFTGLATVAGAQEPPAAEAGAQAPALAAPAPVDLLVTVQEPNASTVPQDLDLAALGLAGSPADMVTCYVVDHWIGDSCSCTGGYVRERLYQQICCDGGCSGLLVTSKTRCTPHGCF